MNTQAKILAFAGSTRLESFNRRLLKYAVEGARASGAEVTPIELADYTLPLFNQDLESREGLPKPAQKLKQLFIEHNGLLLACPEYNSSITPLLKNTLDWVSRSESKEEPSLLAYRGKTAALVSASPGRLGGMRALVQLRLMLGNIGVLVLPKEESLAEAHEAFDGPLLKDEKKALAFRKIGENLGNFLKNGARERI